MISHILCICLRFSFLLAAIQVNSSKWRKNLSCCFFTGTYRYAIVWIPLNCGNFSRKSKSNKLFNWKNVGATKLPNMNYVYQLLLQVYSIIYRRWSRSFTECQSNGDFSKAREKISPDIWLNPLPIEMFPEKEVQGFYPNNLKSS